jgi:hypothetical protein
MTLRKGVVGTIAVVAAALCVCLCVGISFADEDYEPTTLGNDAYDNQVDLSNDIYVDGVDYTSQIANQNSDTVDQALAASVTIGTESDDASPILVTNETGKDITELGYTAEDGTDTGNILSGTLADGEDACWYFTYDEYTTYEYTNTNDDTYRVPINYTIEVTFDDGTTATFHDINVTGVRSINLCYSEEHSIYFVERTTITNHTPDPNLQYEISLASEEDTAEYDFYVNSAASTDRRQITESLGDVWMLDYTPQYTTIPLYNVKIMLYGQPEGEYTDGLYDELHWNSDDLTWRAFDFDGAADLESVGE